MKKLWIFVNGILTLPGSHQNWTGRAVTHCMCYHGLQAEKIEYLSFATIDRMLGQRRRVDRMQKTMQRYLNEDFEIYIAAHSNGCDVVLDTLKWLDWPKVKELHFLSAACEANFELNGLNQAMRNNLVEKFHYYIGKKDIPIWMADSLAGWMFGYGTHPLGSTGPIKHDPAIPDIGNRLIAHVRDDFGHSGWWAEAEFERTMHMILGNDHAV